jgi:hypothetical protein
LNDKPKAQDPRNFQQKDGTDTFLVIGTGQQVNLRCYFFVIVVAIVVGDDADKHYSVERFRYMC